MFDYKQVIENEILIGIYEPTIGFIPIDENNRDYQEYLKHEATAE